MKKKDLKKFYSFENYKPTKNAVPVIYKGTKYLSKAQCMALEGITRKELDAYLKGEIDEPVQIPKADSPVPERYMIDEDVMPLRVNPIDDFSILDD